MSFLLAAGLCAAALTGRAESGQAETAEQVERVAATLLINGIASDPTYGYSPENPLMIGGFEQQKDTAGRLRLAAYFSRVAADLGQPIRWKRLGSCCPFESENGYKGEALLDSYLLTFRGERPVTIFVNHYDAGPLQAPVGMVPFQSVAQRRQIMKAVGMMSEGDREAVRNMLRPIADAGSTMAMYFLGFSHMRAKESEQVVAWLRKAAERGHGRSQGIVGNALRKGIGVEQDWEQGTELLRQAALNRDARSRAQLSYDFRTGNRMEPNLAESALLSHLAAEQGEAASQVAYGMALIQGRGVHKDPATGLAWLAIARAAGNEQATELYERIAPKAPEAVREFAQKVSVAWPKSRQAPEVAIRAQHNADTGDTAAQAAFARMLFNGVLVARNEQKALMYLMLSSKAGNADAKRFLDWLVSNQPNDVVAQARKDAENWRPVAAR